MMITSLGSRSSLRRPPPRLHLCHPRWRSGISSSRLSPLPLRALPTLPPSTWSVWSLLAISAAAGPLLETHGGRLGRALSAPTITLLTSFLFASVGFLPTQAPAYDLIWTKFVPFGTALYLLEAELESLFSPALRTTLLAFLCGVVGSVVGCVVAYAALGGAAALGKQAVALGGVLTASYVGGAVNVSAVAAATGLLEGSGRALLAAAIAADNLVMAIYLAILMAVPTDIDPRKGPDQILVRAGADRDEYGRHEPSAPSAPPIPPVPPSSSTVTTDTNNTGLLLLALASTSAWMGEVIGSVLRIPFAASAITGLLAVWVGTVVRSLAGSGPLRGARSWGSVVMALFFGTLGASVGSLPGRGGAVSWVVPFVMFQVAVHSLVVFALGWMLRLPRWSVMVGSNACVGGLPTVVSMCAARGWPAEPGVIVATLGYLVGTPVGLLAVRMLGGG